MAFARRFKFCFVACLFATVVVPVVNAASAQGLFDFLFGGHYRHAPRPGWGYGYGRPEDRPFPPREERSAPRERDSVTYVPLNATKKTVATPIRNAR